MRRLTYSVLFYAKKSKVLKNGNLPIYGRITVNGQRAEISTKFDVDETEWDASRGMAIGHTKKAKDINSNLELIKLKIREHKILMQQSNEPITASSLKNRYLGIDHGAQTILSIFKEHNEKCVALMNVDFAPGTVERYTTVYKHIEDFIKVKYKKNDLSLNEITPMFISNFEFYLKTSRGCSHNSTVKYIKNFKKIVRIALANGWMKSDPFITIKYHLDEVDMAYLTEDELQKLLNHRFKNERLENVKNIYLFCCFTGLAFIDVKSLMQDDIELKNGQYWMKKKRQKTKNWCIVPLLEPAVMLMEQYKSHPVCLEKRCVLPVLSNQKMNAYLKEIADICGINKHLSTHTARHTFATTVTLANQVSMEVVSKMLGHSSINMTKRYARVVDDLINKDMQKLYGKYACV